MKKIIIFFLIFLCLKAEAQDSFFSYTFLKKNTLKEIRRSLYPQNGLIDLKLNGSELISTGLGDTSTITIEESTMPTGIDDFYHHAMVVSSFDVLNKKMNWSFAVQAQELYRGKTHIINDTLYSAVSFKGKIRVQGIEMEGEEEINGLLLKLDAKGVLLSYKVISGMSFSDFAVNETHLLFAGWYKYKFRLEGVPYTNEMGKIFENNRFYTCYDKNFNQKWVQVASHLIKPHHNHPFHFNNELQIVHVSGSKVYIASWSIGINPLVLGMDTLLPSNIINLLGLANPHYDYNTVRLFTLNVLDGSLSKVNYFFTQNKFGLNFSYDESTDEVKTLIGEDSIIASKHGGRFSKNYKLFANGHFVDYGDEYYMKISFSELYDGLKIEPSGLDYGIVKLVSENEYCERKWYFYYRTGWDSSSYFSQKIPKDEYYQSYLFTQEQGEIKYKMSTNRITLSSFAIHLATQINLLQNEFITLCYSQGMYDLPYATGRNKDAVFYVLENQLKNCHQTAVYIPNAITPNGDGINDSLSLAPQDFKDINWKIFARNGSLVYEGNGCWNGSINGEKAPGVYKYLFKAHTLSGEKIEKQGIINVLDK